MLTAIYCRLLFEDLFSLESAGLRRLSCRIPEGSGTVFYLFIPSEICLVMWEKLQSARTGLKKKNLYLDLLIYSEFYSLIS